MALYGATGPSYTQYKPDQIQELQRLKDRTSEMVMVLEANMLVIISLRKFYVALKSNRDFPLILRRACREDIEIFAASLNEVINGLQMHITRARLLVSILGDRKDLVSLQILFKQVHLLYRKGERKILMTGIGITTSPRTNNRPNWSFESEFGKRSHPNAHCNHCNTILSSSNIRVGKLPFLSSLSSR